MTNKQIPFTNYLLDLDERLFLFLNGLHSPFFDTFMSWTTERNTWIPLYLLLIFIVWRSFPKKQAVIYILYLIVAVGLADYITSGLMKPFFERLRPCYNPDLNGLVHLVGNCGGQFGFVSSHAANGFALFGGILFVFGKNKLLPGIMLLWAILTSYSRIYLGVHYPFDVLMGAAIGFFISFVLSKISNNLLINLTNLE